jgi:hypothetical protein
MMIGAAGVKPDKLKPLVLTAGQQPIEDRRQARQRRAIDRGEINLVLRRSGKHRRNLTEFEAGGSR